MSSCGGVAATGGHRNLGCIGGSTGMAVSSQRVQRFGICLNQPTIKQIFMSMKLETIWIRKCISTFNEYEKLAISELLQIFLTQSETPELSE